MSVQHTASLKVHKATLFRLLLCKSHFLSSMNEQFYIWELSLIANWDKELMQSTGHQINLTFDDQCFLHFFSIRIFTAVFIYNLVIFRTIDVSVCKYSSHSLSFTVLYTWNLCKIYFENKFLQYLVIARRDAWEFKFYAEFADWEGCLRTFLHVIS